MIDLKTPVNQLRYHIWLVVGSDNLYPIDFNVKFEDEEKGLEKIIDVGVSDQKDTHLLGQLEFPTLKLNTLNLILGNVPFFGDALFQRPISEIQVYLEPLIDATGHKQGYIINAKLYPNLNKKIELSPYDFKPDFEHDYFGIPNQFRSPHMPLDIFDKYLKLNTSTNAEDGIVSLSHTMIYTNDLTTEKAKEAFMGFVKTLESAVQLVYKHPSMYNPSQTLVLDINKSVSFS